MSVDLLATVIISIHAPRGGSDAWSRVYPPPAAFYFNPRSPWGERQHNRFPGASRELFQSTLPVGGATWRATVFGLMQLEFQSTLPVGGATTGGVPRALHRDISIHAPRGGSDDGEGGAEGGTQGISIHAPRGGSDCVSQPCIR